MWTALSYHSLRLWRRARKRYHKQVSPRAFNPHFHFCWKLKLSKTLPCTFDVCKLHSHWATTNVNETFQTATFWMGSLSVLRRLQHNWFCHIAITLCKPNRTTKNMLSILVTDPEHSLARIFIRKKTVDVLQIYSRTCFWKAKDVCHKKGDDNEKNGK